MSGLIIPSPNLYEGDEKIVEVNYPSRFGGKRKTWFLFERLLSQHNLPESKIKLFKGVTNIDVDDVTDPETKYTTESRVYLAKVCSNDSLVAEYQKKVYFDMDCIQFLDRLVYGVC